MKRAIWITVLALPLMWIAADQAAFASNAIAEKEDMVCTSCHDKPGSKLLTSEGKYYELMGTTDGFDGVMNIFSECTTCHVKKPGSEKLTATGRRFERLVGDMSGLRELISNQHPFAPADSPEEVENDDPAVDSTEVLLERILFSPREIDQADRSSGEVTQ